MLPGLATACIVYGIHTSGFVISGPVVSASATPTIVNGVRFKRTMRPTTCGSAPKRVIHAS